MRFDRFLPPEATRGMLRVVLQGRERLLIEQHRGIVDYTDSRLTVRLSEGYLKINGECLSIREYTKQDLSVHGKINGLEFSI